MTFTCKEIKRRSRENLLHNFRVPMGALIVVELLATIVDLPFSSFLGEHPSSFQYTVYFAAQFFIAILMTMLSLGIIRLHLNMATKQEFFLSDIFFCFRGQTDRNVLISLCLVLVSILGNIPSYIALFLSNALPFWEGFGLQMLASLVSAILSCFLQMFFFAIAYVAVDQPELPVFDCIRLGLSSMRGHRFQYLRLVLSFLGLYIAVVLTLGIGMLWLIPYQDQTFANFYLEINKKTSAD